LSIEYRYVVDESYLRESLRRSRTKLPWLIRPSVVVPATIAAFSVACFLLLQAGLTLLIVPVVIAAACGIVGSLAAPAVLRRAVLKLAKKGLDFGREVTTILSEEGLESTAPLSQGTTKWAAVEGAIRHADGIVLKIGPMRMWLPDSALRGSTSQDATSFVLSKIKLDQSA